MCTDIQCVMCLICLSHTILPISTSGALFVGQITVDAARRVDAHLHAEKVKKEYGDSKRDFREVTTVDLFGLTAGKQIAHA